MRKIRVSLKQNPYDIVIGRSALSHGGRYVRSLKLGRDAVVISTPPIMKLHGKKLVSAFAKSGASVKVFLVPDGEQSKSAQAAFDLMERIARLDVMKKIFIVAFGGGVVGDLAGFVAAVYKRGVPYIQVPTTLLAQIDSAIGGKTAVDLKIGKNLAGAFYQPRLVLSDVNLLSSLSERQIRNGLAEAVKYGVIKDPGLFQYIEKRYEDLLSSDLKSLEYIVTCGARIKAQVVMADEKETKGIRSILNFGHTIGHAIEAAGQYALYQHGEAIALGMRAAALISRNRLGFSDQNIARLNGILDRIGLPRQIRRVSLSMILKIMAHDKKFSAGKNRFVLASEIGKVRIIENIPLELIQSSIQKLM